MLFKGTPVPIPNTKVKLLEADGTAWETMWESKWLPGSSTIYNFVNRTFFIFLIK